MPVETGKSKKHRESRIRTKRLKGEGWKKGREPKTCSQQKQKQGRQDSEEENSSSLDVAVHPLGPLTYSLPICSSGHVYPSTKGGRLGDFACESGQGSRASAPNQVGVEWASWFFHWCPSQSSNTLIFWEGTYSCIKISRWALILAAARWFSCYYFSSTHIIFTSKSWC